MNGCHGGWSRTGLRAGLCLAGLLAAAGPPGAAEVPTAPANPEASPAARGLLAYLRALPERTDGRLIAGQHCGGVRRLEERYQSSIAELARASGRHVGLVGADFIGGFSDAAQGRLAEHWRAGGLVTLCYHAPNPWTGGPSEDRNIGDLADLTTPGTAAYATWQKTLAQTSQWLAGLRTDGVVVLWRPFHEMNLPGSHWWAGRDPRAFVALWRQMFETFSRSEHLDNLLWVYSPNAEFTAPTKATGPAEAYYPGPDCVDVVGMDCYTRGSLALSTAGYPELEALGKPMALCEFGPRGPAGEREPPDHSYDYGSLLQQLRQDYPRIVYFMAWTDSFSLVRQDGAAELLADPWVITSEALSRRR